MVSNLAQLLENVDYFYKTAGLLKVPETVLKQASDWVIANYCHAFEQSLNDRLSANRDRVKNSDRLIDTLDYWRNIIDRIENLRYADTEAYATKSLDILIELLDVKLHKIVSFDKEAKSDATNMTGKVDKTKNCISMFLDKNNDGTYYIDFDIRPAHCGLDEQPIDITENDVSAQFVIKCLLDNLFMMTLVVNALSGFLDSFYTYSKEYIKNLTILYGTCKRLSSSYTEGQTKHNEKILEFPISDIPYTKIKSNDAVRIAVGFISSNEQAKGLSSSDFGGIWFRSDWAKYPTNNFIGSMYIKSDMQEDIEDIIYLDKFQSKISWLKSITRHEVQHFVQSFLEYISGKKQMGGLPSADIRNTTYDASGFPKKDFIGPHLSDGEDDGRIPHTLRDIEFYTRVSDAADRFNELKTKLPTQLHRDLMLACIDHISIQQLQERSTSIFTQIVKNKKSESQTTFLVGEYIRQAKYNVFDKIYRVRHFFEALKDYQPLKYRKAVSEFVKAIGL